MAKLVFIDKNFAGQSYPLLLDRTFVGRGEHNTLVLRDDSVSSRHCEILLHGAEVIVVDLDSRNGTYVNGVRLNKQSGVLSGQTIRFGKVEARLQLEASDEDSDGSEITAVYAHGRAMREQRRKQTQPIAPDPHATMEPTGHEDASEQTILIPNPARLAGSAAAPAPQPSATKVEQPSWVKKAVWAGVVLAVLALTWWFLGRK